MMLLSLIFNCFFVNSIFKNTVETLDLEKYQGRWYQTYGNNFDQLFEKFSSNVSVVNSYDVLASSDSGNVWLRSTAGLASSDSGNVWLRSTAGLASSDSGNVWLRSTA